jgi:uncharacterized heparinase superfamily protein
LARPSFLRLPGRHHVQALICGAQRVLSEEWRASEPHRWLSGRPQPPGFSHQPRDFRPADPEIGRAILAGAFVLEGATLATGVRGDPWDRPAPSRAFAEALHRFDWLPGLIAAGPDGAAEALRLVLEWRRVFGRWNAFSWSTEIMARRVFNLACAGPQLAARASEAETAQIAADLARQARDLLGPGEVSSQAERAACAAVAGASLRGAAGRQILDRALGRLSPALAATVGAEGGHASRRADLALELLFDLQTLDEVMVQRGLAAPDAVQRAIDRLAATVRFFTLADGALATFQGGRPRRAAYVAAARAQDETGDRPPAPELGGYHRLEGRGLQLLADVSPPAAGAWSIRAADHPLAIQIVTDGRRLIDPGADRTIEGASTVQVGDDRVGVVLGGFPASILGPRLVDAEYAVHVTPHEAPGARWLDVAHHGWMPRHGLMHQRRLYVDVDAGELRGEDRLTPTSKAQGPDGRHFVPYALRFPLHAGVQALVSQDGKSVLLRPEGTTQGWILRNDALQMGLETVAGPDRPVRVLVLRGQRRADSGARVRWKLAPARPTAPPAAAAAETVGKLGI